MNLYEPGGGGEARRLGRGGKGWNVTDVTGGEGGGRTEEIRGEYSIYMYIKCCCRMNSY